MRLPIILSSSLLLAASTLAQAPAAAAPQPVATQQPVAGGIVAAGAPPAQPASTLSEAIAGQQGAVTPAAGASAGAAQAAGGLVAAGAGPAQPMSTLSEAVGGQQGAASAATGAAASPNAGGGLVASGSAPPAAKGSTISEAVGGQGAAGAATSVPQGLGGSATSSAIGAGATSTAAGGIVVHVVSVGSPTNQEIFSPDTVMATPGDLVQFQFYANNHSVASASFDQPCVPEGQSNATAASTAFWSGFMPTTAMGSLTYTIRVRDTNPVWFYCSQAMHCQSGMVGVINPPTSGQTLDMFKQAAAKAPMNISPNSAPGTGGSSGGQIGGSGSSLGTTASSTGSASPAKASKSEACVIRRAGVALVVSLLAAWWSL